MGDFVTKTVLRIGSVLSVPIRQNVKIESVQVVWNKALGAGEIKVYVSDPIPSDSPKFARVDPPPVPLKSQ